jgi:dolichol-phosphate mannosyltransferase
VPVAGLISVLANLCCLHLALSHGLSVHAAWALAFETGTLASFLSYQLITWRATLPSSLHAVLGRAVRFQAAALLALIANLAVFALLMHVGVHYLVADLAGIAAGFCLNATLGLHYAFFR